MKTRQYKLTLRDKLHKHYPCPGFRHHQHPRSGILFDHYCERPQESWRVYWRLHPKEAKQCGILL